MEACRVEEEKPEWRTVGTMAEGRSFLGSAAVGGKVTHGETFSHLSNQHFSETHQKYC